MLAQEASSSRLAVKVIRPDGKGDRERMDAVMWEVHVLRQLRGHENIVTLCDVVELAGASTAPRCPAALLPCCPAALLPTAIASASNRPSRPPLAAASCGRIVTAVPQAQKAAALPPQRPPL